MLGPSTVHKNLRKKNGSASMYPDTIVSLHSSRRMMSTTVLQPSLNAAEGSKSFSFDEGAVVQLLSLPGQEKGCLFLKFGLDFRALV